MSGGRPKVFSRLLILGKEIDMPAYYIAGMKMNGDVQWRPKFTEGLSEEGPADKILMIDLSGPLKGVPWLPETSPGYYNVDIGKLTDPKGGNPNLKWVQKKKVKSLNITEAGENKFVITIEMEG